MNIMNLSFPPLGLKWWKVCQTSHTFPFSRLICVVTKLIRFHGAGTRTLIFCVFCSQTCFDGSSPHQLHPTSTSRSWSFMKGTTGSRPATVSINIRKTKIKSKLVAYVVPRASLCLLTLVSPKKRTLVITSPVFSSLSAHSLISLSSQCSITDPDRIRASTVDGFIPLVAETRVTKFVWVVWYDRPLAWRMNLDVMICDDVKEKAKGPEVWNYCP